MKINKIYNSKFFSRKNEVHPFNSFVNMFSFTPPDSNFSPFLF